MVLPLIPALITVLGIGSIGWIGVSVMSEVIYWGSMLAGLIVFGRTLQILVMDRPVSLTSSETWDNMFYLVFSAALAVIVFQLIQVAFAAAGVSVALVGLVLVAGAWIFGAGAIISGVVTMAAVLSELIE